jgi:hypothetical protein
MMKKALSILGKSKPSPTQALEGLKTFADVVQENHKITEEERTKRHNISAMKDIEIEKIQAQKEILKIYFDGIFSERKYMIEQMFDKLDKGIENNNLELIQMSMSSIVSIAQESPLKQVESLMNDFKSDDVKSITI